MARTSDIRIPTVLLAASVAIALGAAFGCSGSGDVRQMSSGQADPGGKPLAISAAATTTPGATPSPSSADGTGAGVGSASGSVSGAANSSIQFAKTLEQCEASGHPWLAVINSGAKPADCGADLLDPWCCTADENYARFPAMASLLKTHFDADVAAGYKLYHCSVDSTAKTYTFHFGQIGSGNVLYKTVFISGVNPVDTGHNGRTGCPVVTTEMLKVASAPLNFTSDVQPILAANCGGSACHAAGSSLQASEQFNDSETLFKGADKTYFDNNKHVPAFTAAAADLQKLVNFLKQP